MKNLAVVTMVYNEKHKMPIWLRHYRSQVGLENCYVIDHGSTDGSTTDLLGANRLALPRSAQDNEKRLLFVKGLVDGLLLYYHSVAYVDCDEMLVANPSKFGTLSEYAATVSDRSVTSIGLEIWHDAVTEAPLDSSRPVGEQRSFVSFCTSMCKSNLVTKPVTWSPGWHSYDGPVRFSDLFLFHLRHADIGQAVDRLEITRAMDWAKPHAGSHQRVENSALESMIRQFGAKSKLVVSDLLGPDSPLPAEMKSFADRWNFKTAGEAASVPLGEYSPNIMVLPPGFKAALSS